MAVHPSEKVLRQGAYDILKKARETGQSVILARDGVPEAILLPFDAYVRMRVSPQAAEESALEIKALEQDVVDTTICLRSCPLRRTKAKDREG